MNTNHPRVPLENKSGQKQLGIEMTTPTTTERKPMKRKPMSELLTESRAVLSQILKFHIDSVSIGKMARISDTGVIDQEIRECRKLIERADLLCAEIDKTPQPRQRGKK
jgi:hypothetical protein